MGRKAIFFDIDGTLMDETSQIPDSACRAIREMKAAGHAVLICSGRSKGYIFHEGLLSLGFDGIVSGAGAMVEVNGQTLFARLATQASLLRAVETGRAYGYASLLEGNHCLYLDRDAFLPSPYIDKLFRELGERARPLAETVGQWRDVPKLSMIAVGEPHPEQVATALRDEWGVIVHIPEVLELVPRGIDKGTGLLMALRALGIPKEDSVVFGDGANDEAMFREAGVSIAMGNGAPSLRSRADYVTSGLWEDGVWRAWQWLKGQEA